jgi:hypothetical protein
MTKMTALIRMSKGRRVFTFRPFDRSYSLRILTESFCYDAQENRELPPHPEEASEILLPLSDEPAEINLVTL